VVNFQDWLNEVKRVDDLMMAELDHFKEIAHMPTCTVRRKERTTSLENHHATPTCHAMRGTRGRQPQQVLHIRVHEQKKWKWTHVGGLPKMRPQH